MSRTGRTGPARRAVHRSLVYSFVRGDAALANAGAAHDPSSVVSTSLARSSFSQNLAWAHRSRSRSAARPRFTAECRHWPPAERSEASSRPTYLNPGIAGSAGLLRVPQSKRPEFREQSPRPRQWPSGWAASAERPCSSGRHPASTESLSCATGRRGRTPSGERRRRSPGPRAVRCLRTAVPRRRPSQQVVTRACREPLSIMIAAGSPRG